MHDASVDRTTDGGGRVSRLSLAALRELDAGGWFSPEFSGERVPTLEEVFESVGSRLLLNIELTNYATPRDDLVARVAAVVNRHGLARRVLFSSFNGRNLQQAKRHLSEIPCGLLAWAGLPGWQARTIGFRRDSYQALHPHVSDIDAGLVARVHAAGKRLNVWTVNAEEDLARMVRLSADGIITDDPGLALRLLGGPR
jgi:glycerophosphoryl diester phosphodiesterase